MPTVRVRVLLAVSLAAALSGCRCGRPPEVPPDGGVDAGPRCERDTDCPLGEECQQFRCFKPTLIDAGLVPCTQDSQCPAGQKCLPSTNTCFTPAEPDGGEEDGGFVGSCLPGQQQSCGSSKFGECRLGIETCAEGTGGWQWSACLGAIDPVAESCNGKDDDCDGLDDDGLADVSCGVGECARTVPSCVGGQSIACTPGSPSAEACDGKDNDCDGQIDEDLPALSCGVGECARTAPACVNGVPGSCVPGPVAAELCNGKDDDCDGTADDGFGTASCGQGICARSAPTCVAGAPNACVPGPSATETCNTLDDDCDGVIDEGCVCTNGATQGCYTGPPGTVGVGPCVAGTQTCVGGAWAACTGQRVPVNESCDGVDNNCNGQTDEGLGQSSCGTGICARTVNNCVGGANQTCTPGPAGTESCNNLDDDCDGATDEALGNVSCGVGACFRSVALCVSGVTQSCTPGAPGTEVCNNVDDDCDGSIDESFPQEGQSCPTGVPGLCAVGTSRCQAGVIGCQQTVMPVAETCNNGTDENCNGAIDEMCGCSVSVDKDFDGANECVDCNDNDGTIRPGAAETCNGKDDDCDGTIDEGFDVDGDGFTTCGTQPGGGLDVRRIDCNDNNSFIFPLKTTDCGGAATPNTANSVDDNCNGYVDETCGCQVTRDADGDGSNECLDCNDNDPNVRPGGTETCDGKDNDCNRLTIENCGVSDFCGFKQGNTWYRWPTGTDKCRSDLICVSNVSTGELTCGSFCNQTLGQGLNDSCSATQGCTRNLIDSDNLHLCSVTPVGSSAIGATCSVASNCRSGDCRTDGTVKYCSDKCTHEASCTGQTTCVLEQVTFGGPPVFNKYNYSWCRADSQITGTKTLGQTCTGSECRTGAIGCLNGKCVEPCCANADCPNGYVCSVNGPKVATGYSTGGSSIASLAPVCLASTAVRVSGQACTTSSQCKSGICDNASSICVDICCNDSSCPNGTTCEPLQLKLATGEVTTARMCVFSPLPTQVVQK